MKKRYVTFNSCKHEGYAGRARYEMGGNLIQESGCCVDCRWNMKRNIETMEFEKTTKFSKTEAERLDMYRALRGLK